MRPSSLIALIALALGASDPASAQDQTGAPGTIPPLAATKHNAEAVFFLDVSRCLVSLENGGGVEGLADRMKAGLRPATPSERFLFKDPAVKVWAQDPFGAHVLLAEKSPERCDVVADQLSVDETFHLTLSNLKKVTGDFSDVPVRSGYNPVAYQIERVENGVRYVVHLEGSEPGGLAHPGALFAGHAYRYSLLNAFVVKQAESATPPFR